MKRRKWKAPNNPTAPAKQIWRAVYNEPWPTGWTVKWAGFMRGASGLTDYERKEIVLNYGDAKSGKRVDHHMHYQHALSMAFWHAFHLPFQVGDYEWWARRASRERLEIVRHTTMKRGAIEVLVHEFVHVRNPEMRHGKEFDRLVEWARARLLKVELFARAPREPGLFAPAMRAGWDQWGNQV
jgi:hypothetical protein